MNETPGQHDLTIDQLKKELEDVKHAYASLVEKTENQSLQYARRIAELSKSEDYYKKLYYNAPVNYQSLDENACFIDVNPSWLHTLGYTREEVIGHHFSEFMTADSARLAEIRFPVFKKNGRATGFEFELKRKDGEVIYVNFDGLVETDLAGNFKQTHCICTDITNRRNAEQKLRESEVQFKALVESSSDMIWETNLEGKYVYVSPQFETLLGYKPAEAVGTSPFAYIVDTDLKNVISNSDELVKAEKPFNSLVNKYRHRNGHTLYFETSGVPVFSASGDLLGYRGVSRDITQRRKAEKELYKLSSVVQQNPNTVIITDLDGIIEYINPAGCEISGYSATELLGKNPSVFASGNTPKSTYRQLWKTIKDGEKWTGVFHNRKKNGELFWESALIVPVRDAEGNITNYLGVKEDISQRIKFEDILKESEERYRQLFETSPDAIILADIETGQLLDANPAACALLGHSLAKIRTLHQSMIHPEAYREMAAGIFQQQAQLAPGQKGLQPYESVVLRSDGTEVSVEVLANNIALNGRHILQGVFRDITERLQARNALMQAMAKAEASDKLKSAFLRNISHELRTPLNGIIGFSEMIARMDNSEEDRMEFSQMIKKSSTRLINTINGYMDISMIVSGLTELKKRTFSLAYFLNKIVKQAEVNCQSHSKQIEVILDVPEADIQLFTDEDLLTKIFQQLSDNAVKFTPKGTITMGCEPIPGFLKFNVSDTGSGISPEQLHVIFDIFRQVDGSITRSYEGSGLGLAIARGYVKLLGGDIWVESELNLGSAFFFTIPADTVLAGNATVSPKNKQKNISTVIVAEDDDSNYKYLEIVLKKAAFKVLRARNGLETLKLCENIPDIRLLITDMKMPGMDGIESTRKIRTFLPDLPIIALSGLISSHDEQLARTAGCNEYLVKPVSKAKLLETISNLLQQDIVI